jgi:hypothetical protein
MNSPIEKFLIVELQKKNREGGPTLDQYITGHWICNAQAPIGVDGTNPSLDGAIEECGSRLARDEAEVHESWSGALPPEIWEALESIGTLAGLSGIAVLEVVLHAKKGPIFPRRPRRFLVVQRGMGNAIYACDNFNEAFTVADELAKGNTISLQYVDAIAKPPSHGLKREV